MADLFGMGEKIEVGASQISCVMLLLDFQHAQSWSSVSRSTDCAYHQRYTTWREFSDLVNVKIMFSFWEQLGGTFRSVVTLIPALFTCCICKKHSNCRMPSSGIYHVNILTQVHAVIYRFLLKIRQLSLLWCDFTILLFNIYNLHFRIIRFWIYSERVDLPVCTEQFPTRLDKK